jgi:hypothetical protein
MQLFGFASAVTFVTSGGGFPIATGMPVKRYWKQTTIQIASGAPEKRH